MLGLADSRRLYQPQIPQLLQELNVEFQPVEHPKPSRDIAALFPHTAHFSALRGVQSRKGHGLTPMKIGVVFSGGPAPGGHNVVAGIFDTLQKGGTNSELIGFLGGPEALIAGSYKTLKSAEINHFRNQGGFHLLGSGRMKIETPAQFQAVLTTVLQLKLDGLVIIGGDDSNTNAAHLAEYFLKEKAPTRIIGVPKTIDGDIQNSYVPISFGFDTASKIYSEMIGNLAYDTLSSLKYDHFVKLMGRSASHLTLECALKTHPNITLITEEKKPFKTVVQELAQWVVQRDHQKTPYGLILIPEGLLEGMPDLVPLIKNLAKTNPDKLAEPLASTWKSLPEKIQKQLFSERDPHGNINLSIIDTELLLIEAVQQELAKTGFKGKFQPLPHFYGYEGRCGHPSNFDANYSYALGCIAPLLIHHHLTGMMAYVQDLARSPTQWVFGGVPLTSLLKLEERTGVLKPVIAKALVDLQSAPFKQLQKYRTEWLLHSAYQNPGPLQFEGPRELIDSFPLILRGNKN